MHIKSVEYFRATAILIIVAGHSYQFGFSPENNIMGVIETIITGGTALFVFVSGFMFDHVFKSRFNYRKFIVNKIMNVGLPYFIMSGLAIFLLYVTNSGFYDYSIYVNRISVTDVPFFNSGDNSILITLKYFLTGRHLTAYWYIPFVLLLFVMAPLHQKYCFISYRYQLLIFVLLSFVSMIVQRPVLAINAFQSIIYYTPVYLFGIIISQNKEKILRLLERKEIYIALFVVLLAVIQVCFYSGGNQKRLFELTNLDISYIQKLALCLFLFVLLNRFEEKESPTLTYIANVSFGIFFLHPWFISIFDRITVNNYSIFSYIFFVIINVLMCILAIKIIKLCINCINVPKLKSRLLIGC